MTTFWDRGHLARISGETIKDAGGTPAVRQHELTGAPC